MTDDVTVFRPRPIAPDAIRTLRHLVEETRRLAATVPEGHPFLLLTPLGMSRRPLLARLLAEQGIGTGQVLSIPDYRRVSSVLYTRVVSDKRMRMALDFEDLWASLFPDGRVECWEIPDPDHYERLLRKKSSLRERMGERIIRVIPPDISPNPTAPTGWIVPMKAFHVPDTDDWRTESRVIRAFPYPSTE